jgi:hypothetical protein
MKKLAFIALAPAILLGCVDVPATGSATSAVDHSANFDAAVASIGCELKFESDYLPVELQTGMSREDLQKMAAIKVRRGHAVALGGGGIRSTVGSCDPAAQVKQS